VAMEIAPFSVFSVRFNEPVSRSVVPLPTLPSACHLGQGQLLNANTTPPRGTPPRRSPGSHAMDRSSQRSRISPGRPGSRRRRRFEAQVQLLSQLDPQERRELMDPSVMCRTSESSHLQRLLSDPECYKAFKAFTGDRVAVNGKKDRPLTDRWRRIPKDARRTVRRLLRGEPGFIDEFECKLRLFLQGCLENDDPSFSFSQDLLDPFQGLLAKSVCQYYGDMCAITYDKSGSSIRCVAVANALPGLSLPPSLRVAVGES